MTARQPTHWKKLRAIADEIQQVELEEAHGQVQTRLGIQPSQDLDEQFKEGTILYPLF